MGIKKNHKVAVLGGGSFGTVIANIVANNGYPVTLWLRSEALAAEILSSGENADYLPGYTLNPNIAISTDLEESVKHCESVFLQCPAALLGSSPKKLVNGYQLMRW